MGKRLRHRVRVWQEASAPERYPRSGDPAVISGYVGKSDAFDKALAAFSVAYADQTERDHASLKRAIRQGRVKAVVEEPTR